MSHRDQLRAPYQRTFQKECWDFVKKAEATANHARKYPNNHEFEPNSAVYNGLFSDSAATGLSGILQIRRSLKTNAML
ncbi:hypothetical protein N7516_006893 [Penicillium verrucosum]|uniref:uncharacterized protein n=1 Tax=Penicillium verrucosum TaxID=60171 RepID=UPI002545A940|nr:uncharacterized protein N7516_006893 [Penicillium verrucosum]KAJ5932404.1 hypothetical protein N7516_006893 [Penicillium verrucosum]